jgi:hypothetical protein
MGPVTKDTEQGNLNRVPYIEHVYGEAIRLGLVPVYWDDAGDFGMMNRNTGQTRTTHNSAAVVAAMRKAAGRQ